MALPLDLDVVLQTLRSPRVLGAIATAASLTLLLRSFYAFQPPKPVRILPSIRNAPKSADLVKLKEAYPEDFYSGGAYFRGPFGATRYFVLGKGGPKVVLVHGLSIPSPVWKPVAEDLVKRGYQVLLYDIYGRGYSDAPNVPYTPALYTTQLALLMQYLQWEKAYIVGLSMGGAIATAFAANHSHLVNGKVVLIAPVGLLQPEGIKSLVFMSNLVFSPFLSLSAVKVWSLLHRRMLSPYFSQWILGKPNVENLPPEDKLPALQRAALPGFLHALASSLRHGPLAALEWAYIQAGSAGSKVQFLHIHGTRDSVVPYKYTTESIAAFIPADRLQHLRLDGAEHDLVYDEKFVPILLEHLDAFLRD
ncbi:alpha/beta-hydrolase [Auriculariales sp. MPI-PUGE-AT-0066]|nr:alpha/beta-hydrolase [Auriculariales sp. MPI-PUGE-AT-0066]